MTETTTPPAPDQPDEFEPADVGSAPAVAAPPAAPAETPAVPAPPRPKRWKRWLIIIAGSLVGLVLLLVLLTPVIVNRLVRPKLVAALSEQLKAPVTIESASFSWFSGLAVEGVKVGNVPGGDAGELFTLAGVQADLSLPALLMGRIVLKRDLVIDSPQVRLVMHADGTTNVQALLDKLGSAAPAPKPTPPSSASAAAPLPYVVGKVVIKDARLTVVEPKGKEIALPALTVSVAVDTFAKPVQVDLASADRALVFAAKLQLADGSVTGTVNYHLDPAFSVALRPLLVLAPMVGECDLTVAGDGELAITGPVTVNGKGSLTIAANRVVVTIPGAAGAPATTYSLAPGETKISYDMQAKEGGAVEAKIAVASPAAKADLTANGVTDAKGQKIQANITTALDLAELGRRFPGIIGDPRRGALVGTIEGSVTASALMAGSGVAGNASLALSGKGIGEQQADGKVVPIFYGPLIISGEADFDTVGGRYALRQGAVHVTGLDLAADAKATLVKSAPADSGGQSPASALAGIADLSVKAKVNADLDQMFAAARRLVPALPAAWDISGTVVSNLAIDDDKDKPELVKVDFKLKADRLHLRGFAPLPEIDLSPSVTMVVAGTADLLQGRLVLDRAGFDSPPCDISASGTRIKDLFTAKPQATLDLRVRVRPGSVAMIAAPLLDGITFVGDVITLMLMGKAGAEGGVLTASVQLPRLSVTLPGKDAATKPATVTVREGLLGLKILGEAGWTRFRVEGLGQDPRPRLEFNLVDGKEADAIEFAAEWLSFNRATTTGWITGLRVTAPGVKATFNCGFSMPGALADTVVEPTTFAVQAELKPLLAFARRWAGVFGVNVPVDGEGQIALDVKACGKLDQFTLIPVIEATNLRLSGQGLERAVNWPVSAKFDADLRCAPLALTNAPLVINSLHLQAPGLDCAGEQGSLIVADLLAAMNNLLDPKNKPAGNSPVTMNLKATITPTKLIALLPALAGRKELTVAPDATATFTIDLTGTAQSPRLALNLTAPPASITVPAKRGSGKPAETIALKGATVSCAVAIDCAKGTVTLDKLAVVTDLAKVEGGVVATLARTSGGGLAALEAKLTGGADLNRLVAVAGAMGLMPEGVTLSGDRLDWSLTASTSGGDIPLALTFAIPNCAFSQPAMTLPKQDVKLELRGILKDKGQVLVIDQASKLAATTAQATLRGTLRGLTTQPAADGLAIGLTYEPAQINPLLKGLGGGTLNGAKAESSLLALSGPLAPPPGADLMAWLGMLNTHDTTLAFGSWTIAGFTIVGPPLPLKLAQGKLDLAYKCTVNEGATELNVAASLPKEHADLRVSVANLHLTNDLAWLVAYVNPIFHLDQQGTLAGFASLAIEKCAWQGPFMPVQIRPALGTSLEANGNFSATKVAITGSKLLTALVDALAAGASGDLIEVSPTNFLVHQGVVSYQDMKVRIGAMTLVFGGTANLVTDALDMTVVAPFPSKLAGAGAKYAPETLTMPIHGTIADPQYDFKGAVADALKQVLKKAATDEVKDRAGGLLKGLLKH
jgi:hypothetical protein